MSDIFWYNYRKFFHNTLIKEKVAMLARRLYEKEEFESFCESVLQNILGKIPDTTDYDKYKILALSQKAILTEKWLETQKRYEHEDKKKIYCFSLEFLMGRFMRNAIDNLDMEKSAEDALKRIAIKLEDLYEEEQDAGLGNGGLGRLAARFLDSMATMDIPGGYGVGIRYEYGMFSQEIEDGWQVEKPDNWLFKNNPWEIQRIEDAVKVKFYGKTKGMTGDNGEYEVEWIDTEEVLAMPYILLIPGYKTETVR